MNKVKNILVLQSRIEILVTVPGLSHGVPVCGFHTRQYEIVLDLDIPKRTGCTKYTPWIFPTQVLLFVEG